MLDRDESALHAVQLSLHGRALLDDPDVVLADIRDRDALTQDLRRAPARGRLPRRGAQAPADARAVPGRGDEDQRARHRRTCSRPRAAVGVERFVNISTDKAADPTSVLGLLQADRRAAHRRRRPADTAATYLSVRFGNVLGSRGSVLDRVRRPDRRRRPGHRHRPRRHPLLHDRRGGRAAGHPGRRDRPATARRWSSTWASRCGSRRGPAADRAVRPRRHRDRLHRPAPGREAPRGAARRRRARQRPAHPLISHVPVPELNAALVQSQRVDIDEDEMRKRLYDWCVHETAPLQEDREFSPRSWSGIEG